MIRCIVECSVEPRADGMVQVDLARKTEGEPSCPEELALANALMEALRSLVGTAERNARRPRRPRRAIPWAKGPGAGQVPGPKPGQGPDSAPEARP